MNAISSRMAGVLAVLFSILMVAGVFIGFNSPEDDAPDQEWIDYVNDSDKLVQGVIGAYLLVIAAIVFLAFIVAMYQRIRSVDTSGDGSIPMLMLVTGIGWSFAMMSGALLSTTIAGGIEFGGSTEPTPDVARWIDQIGFGIWLVGGGLCAALTSALLSSLILRTKILPGWVAYFGFLAAIAMLGAVIFIPMIVFALWMLTMGIVLLTSSEEPVPATA